MKGIFYMNKFLRNIFYLFLPLVLGGIVGLIISKSIDYNSLIQPPLAPPSLAFPIAWTIIYLLMGLSYFLFQKNVDSNKVIISIIYYLQLFVNLMWPIIFFLFKWRLFSILWIILLIFFVSLLIYLMFKEYPVSSYLLIPYLLWTLFATYLNIGIYILN